MESQIGARLKDGLHGIAGREVRLSFWDELILGSRATLRSTVMTAREVAVVERERWARGRFPSVHLCVADAIFSKQKGYTSTVLRNVRRFHVVFGDMSLADLVSQEWESVYAQLFEVAPRPPKKERHGHVSPEGRVRTIHDACRVFHRLGLVAVDEVHRQMKNSADYERIRKAVTRVHGLKDDMFANIAMNMGHLTIKLDEHVRRFLSPILQLPEDAPRSQYLERLGPACESIDESLFEVDQMIWYAHSPSARV